jgi:hypothetical protein
MTLDPLPAIEMHRRLRGCERPGCEFPARHWPHIRGEVVEGWSALCCHHTDYLMATAAQTVDRVEAEDGWASWLAAHEQSCGAPF